MDIEYRSGEVLHMSCIDRIQNQIVYKINLISFGTNQ